MLNKAFTNVNKWEITVKCYQSIKNIKKVVSSHLIAAFLSVIGEVLFCCIPLFFHHPFHMS